MTRDGERPSRFRASGSFLLGNTADLEGYGITRNEFQQFCRTPTSQGLDGYVIEIPPELQMTDAFVKLIGSDVTGLYDVDVYFYTEDCKLNGSAATETVPEIGIFRSGTHYAVVSSTHGAGIGFEIRAIERR